MHSQIISATKFFPLYNLNFPVAQSVLSFEDGINCGAVLDKVIQLLRKDVAHVLRNVRVLQCIYKACHKSLSSSKRIHVKSPISVSKDCLSTIPPPHRSCNWSDSFKRFHKYYKYLCNYCVSHAWYLPHQNSSMILSAVVKRGDYKCPYYDSLCNFPLLPLPQVQMFPTRPFISYARDMLEKKGCYIKGRNYSTATTSTKSSSQVSSFLVTTTTTTKTFLFPAMLLSVGKFSNKALFVVPLARLPYIRSM